MAAGPRPASPVRGKGAPRTGDLVRRIAALVLLALAPSAARPAAAARAAAPAAPLSADEEAYCEEEIGVVERRRKVFVGQGLGPREIARRNAAALLALEECRAAFRAHRRRTLEERQDLAEVARRVGPDATEKERAQAWREVRRERLAARSPSTLTAEERAELAAGMPEELAATRAALDAAHARDPAFMRVVHSALACFHGERRESLEEQIGSERALLALGNGDRQRLYALRSALRESEEVLARSREAARGYRGGLEGCASPGIALVSHCLAVRFQDRRSEPACDSEEIQQYVRLVK